MRVALFLLALSLWGLVHAVQINVVHPHSPSSSEEQVFYEAERAFLNTRGVPTTCQLGDKLRSQFRGGAALEVQAGSYAIFTVNIPEDGVYPVTFVSYKCSDSQSNTLDVYANGLPLHSGLELAANSSMAAHDLNLRFGLNTLKYVVHGDGVLALDYIKIKGGAPMATRGATVTYEEVEAENSRFQGTKIGPSKVYTTLPSEASGRTAVQLTSSGQYVEFSPTKSFNAIVVRFSIPNSANGIGQAANLILQVNGQQVTVLNVTSYWSWAYGTMNDYTRDPGAGFPHHFYDDVRYMFKSSYPANTKVRVVSASSIVYTIDLADFYTVPAPYTMPSGYLSVVDYGADPTGVKDSGGPFQIAFNAWASKNAAGIWIPAGKYSFTYSLNLRDNMIVRGAGPWYTEMHGHNFGFYGQNCHKCGVFDFAVFGTTNVRNDGDASSGVGSSLNNAQVQNVWIERNKCGMWLNGPYTGLHISAVTIRNTFADGINFNIGVTSCMVEQSVLRNNGDDNLAMWANGSPYGNNVFQFNTLSLPILANTIAIYGGTDNSATDNICSETLLEGAGLQVGTRFGSTQLGGTTTFARNTLVRCGSADMYNPVHVEGAIWLYADSSPINTPIIFQDIDIQDAYFQAIEFFKGDVSNVKFSNINVNGAKYLFDTLVSVNIYIEGLVATNITTTLNNCKKLPFNVTQGSGNKGWDLSNVGCEA